MVNKKLATYALIISSYTAISLILGSFSFGMIQVRIAEVLLVLCLSDKQYILPITIGCFLTNLLGLFYGLNPLAIDVVVGTLATLISAYFVYSFKNIKLHEIPLLSLIMPVLVNGIMIGIELHFYFPINIGLMILYVALGEFISVTILGLLLYKPIIKAIEKYRE